MRYTFASRRFIVAVSLVLTLGIPFSALADVITLQLPDIPGDSKFAANNGLPPDSIRVLTVGNSVEATESCVGGGGCSGKAILTNLSIVKKFGESSAALFLNAVQGRHLINATISFYRMKTGAPVKYYTITLSDVRIASQTWEGNSSAVDTADTEKLELGYSRITLLDNETGSRACYDLRTADSSC